MPELHAFSDSLALALLWTAWVGGMVLGLSYMIFFRWYRTKAGRAFMYVIAGFVLLLTVDAVSNSTGDSYWGREVLRPVAFSLIALSTLRVSWILWTGWWDRIPRPMQQGPIRTLSRSPKPGDGHDDDHPFLPKGRD